MPLTPDEIARLYADKAKATDHLIDLHHNYSDDYKGKTFLDSNGQLKYRDPTEKAAEGQIVPNQRGLYAAERCEIAGCRDEVVLRYVKPGTRPMDITAGPEYRVTANDPIALQIEEAQRKARQPIVAQQVDTDVFLHFCYAHGTQYQAELSAIALREREEHEAAERQPPLWECSPEGARIVPVNSRWVDIHLADGRVVRYQNDVGLLAMWVDSGDGNYMRLVQERL
jgi:hypothetical protein